MRLVFHNIWLAIAVAITQLLINCSDCWNPLLLGPLTLAQTGAGGWVGRRACRQRSRAAECGGDRSARRCFLNLGYIWLSRHDVPHTKLCNLTSARRLQRSIGRPARQQHPPGPRAGPAARPSARRQWLCTWLRWRCAGPPTNPSSPARPGPARPGQARPMQARPGQARPDQATLYGRQAAIQPAGRLSKGRYGSVDIGVRIWRTSTYPSIFLSIHL